MAGKITMTISVDEGIKNEFQTMCEASGLQMSTAIQMFMLTCVRTGEFDFHIPVRSHYRYETMEVDSSLNDE